MVVPHRIAAEPSDVLCQHTINNGSGIGSRRNIAGDPRITPCGRVVPEILDCWIVVEAEAVNQFLAAPLRLIREADIGVIASEMVRLGFIRHLKETADVAGPCSREKEGHILRNLKIAILSCGHGRIGVGK